MRSRSDGLRRFAAGLAFLAVLALSFGQTIAAPLGVMSCCDDVVHCDSASLPLAHAGHHDSGSPHKQQNGTHGPDCCIVGSCSLLSAALVVAVPMIPAVPEAITYRPARKTASESLDTIPALPPPRHTI